MPYDPNSNEPLLVFVPTESRAGRLIDPRSGIIGYGVDGTDDVVVYFESNRYGAQNIVTWADRCWHSADRCRQNYPTSATMVLARDDLHVVGVFDPDTRGVRIIDPDRNVPIVATWLGIDLDAVDAETRVTS